MGSHTMFATARYLADFARFAATKGSQEQHDRQALAELERRPLALAAGLRVRWLGVSGYRFDYEGHTLLVDPYISRVPLASVLARRPALPDPALIDRHLGTPENCVGILVGHTHSFTPSAHSKLMLGLAVPFDGELTCDHLDALSPGAYRCGEIYGIEITVAGMSFYHQGSANLIDDAVRSTDVDVFLAGVAGRGFTRQYWRRILTRLQPKTIVPTHYDDFFRPLDAEMGFTTNVNLAHVPDEVHAVSREFEVAALPLATESPR